MSQIEFFSRYRCVANPFNPKNSKLPMIIPEKSINGAQLCRELVELLLDNSSKIALNEKNLKMQKIFHEMQRWRKNTFDINVKPETVQVGKTKVFLRKDPYDVIESRRVLCISIKATKIESIIRGKLKRIWLKRLYIAVEVLQVWFRRVLYRRKERTKRRRIREAKLKAKLLQAEEDQKIAEELKMKCVVVESNVLALNPTEAAARITSIEEQFHAGRKPGKATLMALDYFKTQSSHDDDNMSVASDMTYIQSKTSLPPSLPRKSFEKKGAAFKCVCIMNKFGTFCGNSCKCKKFGRQCGPRCRCSGNSAKCLCHPEYYPAEHIDWSHPDTVKSASIKAIKEHLEGVQLSSFGSNIELRNRIRDYYKIGLTTTLPAASKRTQGASAATLIMLNRPGWRR